jgi:hypothetical protein
MVISILKTEPHAKVAAHHAVSALNVASVLSDLNAESDANAATVTVLKLLLLPVPAALVLLQLVWWRQLLRIKPLRKKALITKLTCKMQRQKANATNDAAEIATDVTVVSAMVIAQSVLSDRQISLLSQRRTMALLKRHPHKLSLSIRAKMRPQLQLLPLPNQHH